MQMVMHHVWTFTHHRINIIPTQSILQKSGIHYWNQRILHHFIFGLAAYSEGLLIPWLHISITNDTSLYRRIIRLSNDASFTYDDEATRYILPLKLELQNFWGFINDFKALGLQWISLFQCITTVLFFLFYTNYNRHMGIDHSFYNMQNHTKYETIAISTLRAIPIWSSSPEEIRMFLKACHGSLPSCVT